MHTARHARPRARGGHVPLDVAVTAAAAATLVVAVGSTGEFPALLTETTGPLPAVPAEHTLQVVRTGHASLVRTARATRDTLAALSGTGILPGQHPWTRAKGLYPRRRPAVHAVSRVQAQHAEVSTDTASARHVTLTSEVKATGSEVADYALRFKGTPYVYGGATPEGWDCSGFAMFVYAHSGITIPRVAEDQYQVFKPVSEAQAVPGDAVFYLSGGYAYHTAIYIGDGMVISALDPQYGTVVTPVSFPGPVYAFGQAP